MKFPQSTKRRTFLRSTSACLSLPVLESLANVTKHKKNSKNFIAIGTYLGFYAKGFYPQKPGPLKDLSPTLKPLEQSRKDISIFSGLDHRSLNGHEAWSNFLSGHYPNTYSLDQKIADHIGQKSRFPSIELTAGAGEALSKMSFTKQGINLPMINRPSVFYKMLFMSKTDLKNAQHILKTGKSSLDFVYQDAKRLSQSLSKRDVHKLDEYFSSLRSVEKRMGQMLNNLSKPLPKTSYKLPSYDPITPNLQLEAEDLMYDLMTLALDSESTRVISMFIHGLGQVFTIDGETLKTGYHGLSHHGNNPDMIADLMKIDRAHVTCLARFIKQLSEKKDEQGKRLLDKTIILFGTGMGDASRHSNRDLPMVVAGGGLKHGKHHSFKSNQDHIKLGSLYITIMQQLGMNVDTFSNAKHNLNQILL